VSDRTGAAGGVEGLQDHIRELNLPATETFADLYPERDYEVRLEVPQFTCICPRTSLPNFASGQSRARARRRRES
jgi:NADPH-dependent 7-cyano-7-deazaguanine reductase QueF